MQTFIKPLTELAEFTEIRDRMRKGRGIYALTGCIDAQKSHMVHGLSDGVLCMCNRERVPFRKLF